jgi:hypothetical protein
MGIGGSTKTGSYDKSNFEASLLLLPTDGARLHFLDVGLEIFAPDSRMRWEIILVWSCHSRKMKSLQMVFAKLFSKALNSPQQISDSVKEKTKAGSPFWSQFQPENVIKF